MGILEGADIAIPIGNPQSAIGNRLVEAPRIELGSKRQRRRTLHAYSLLFLVGLAPAKLSPIAESVK